MEYLERYFKNHPVTFVLISFIIAALIASIFQEIGGVMTNILNQAGWHEGYILFFWFGVVISTILIGFEIDRRLILRRKKINIDWITKNDKYARIRIINKENSDLFDCVSSLVGSIQTEEIGKSFNTKYQNFSWSDEAYRGDSQRITDIPKGEEALLDIAKVENGKLCFTFAYNTEIRKEIGLLYLLIKISGYKNGYSFEAKKQFKLDFPGDSVMIE